MVGGTRSDGQNIIDLRILVAEKDPRLNLQLDTAYRDTEQNGRDDSVRLRRLVKLCVTDNMNIMNDA